jgi:hypothetical protein
LPPGFLAEDRTILARVHRLALGAVAGVVILVVLSLSPVGGNGATAPPSATHAPITPTLRSSSNSAAGSLNNTSGLECAGVYWASSVWANYSPSWCYGEDEATINFVSTAPGSGEDANYSFILPADGTYTQGDFYDTIWLGGVVYDPSSLDSQAFLEFQFYPAPPEYPANGASDCLTGGVFYPNYTPGSNEWFACAVVWQVVGNSENAAFSGPLDFQGSSSIFILHSNDQVYVNETGVAQSTTLPWQLTVTDATTHDSGSVSLLNGTKVLSPFYTTAAEGNDLVWGADVPGTVSLAYEDGHSLNPAIPEGGYYDGCYPGDGKCDSYWPGRWAASGQMQLSLPVLGSPGNQTFPYDVGFGSAVEGENWINGTYYEDSSTCTAPSWSTSTNCLYPWYTYRAQNYSFDFGANNQTNNTHDYGSLYEFPAAAQSVRFHAAPWGVLDSSVTPAFAHVEFNRIGTTTPVPVLPNGTAYRQFAEGSYWLNVSYPGCPSTSEHVYLSTGGVYNTPIQLACPGLYNVTFTESGLPHGTLWSVTLDGATVQDTTSEITIYAANGTQSYIVLSPVPGTTGIRYLATPNNGTVDVMAAPVSLSVAFSPQYEFMATGVPNGAVAELDPDFGWEALGTQLQVTVIPGLAWELASWTGVGNGSYSGPANPAPVTMNGPVVETAFFTRLFTVAFNEGGLPPSTTWHVDLNGIYESGSGPTINFEIPNGSYSYNISGPGGYTISPQTGSFSVNDGNANVAVQFAQIVFLGLTALEVDIIVIVVVAIGVAVGINVAFWLSHRKRPPAPTPPSSPPPPWLGGPPGG